MRLTFRAKLAAIVCVAALALGLVIVAGAASARSVEQQLVAVKERYVPRVELEPQLSAAFERLVRSFQDAVASHDKDMLAATESRRSELIELLDDEELLPAIVFIFSRAACDDAVRQCLREGLRLTTGAERASIRRIAEARVENLADDDLEVLGFSEWVEGLEAGIAAHHAGLVPAYRETVEECFEAGHLKVVFATETLSLGINMPARTTVIERFTKFGGAGRATLTSGEYAQLTGRAGRRGLDAEGHAVVLWTPETTFANVARVAVAPPPDLRSAFRPTYNLAVNLVSRFDKASTIEVLRHSFAQWQLKAGSPSGRDVLVEHLEKRLRVLEEMGYVEDWSLTPAGHRLSRVYHESDLLVSEALGEEALRGAEPSVLSGVLSALVFERRRTRPAWAHANHRDVHRDGKRASHRWGSGKRPGGGGDRLGEKRRNEIAERTTLLVERCEVVRALEQSHALPRSPNAEPSLATAVTAWARGASFGTALEIASKEAGDLAPGDFVRTVRQLADLVSQIALVAPDPETAESATVAHGLLMRDVVAAGASPASAIADVTPS